MLDQPKQVLLDVFEGSVLLQDQEEGLHLLEHLVVLLFEVVELDGLELVFAAHQAPTLLLILVGLGITDYFVRNFLVRVQRLDIEHIVILVSAQLQERIELVQGALRVLGHL